MQKKYKNYIVLGILSAVATVLLINFIIIKKIDNEVMRFANHELQTPMVKYKIRCTPGNNRHSLLFFNYKKQLQNCKIYHTSFGQDQYVNDEFHTIPLVDVSYKLFNQHYEMQFNQLNKVNKKNALDNYTLNFEQKVHFEIDHDNKIIKQVLVQNDGAISLMHSTSSIVISTIDNHGLYFSYDDRADQRVFDVDAKVDFQITSDFAAFAKNEHKKLALNLLNKNKIEFDFSVIFERFDSLEREQLIEHNPNKYLTEKDFLKSMIYDIKNIKISSPNFDASLTGVVKKMAKPGAPYTDITLNLQNATTLVNYAAESMQNNFYNRGQTDLYNTIKPHLIIEAFMQTLRELNIMNGKDVLINIKNDEIGGLSISGVNFFIFQQKLMFNFIKLRGADSADTNNIQLDMASNSDTASPQLAPVN